MARAVGEFDQYNGGAEGLPAALLPRDVRVFYDEERDQVVLDDGMAAIRMTPPEARGLGCAIHSAWSRTREASS